MSMRASGQWKPLPAHRIGETKLPFVMFGVSCLCDSPQPLLARGLSIP